MQVWLRLHWRSCLQFAAAAFVHQMSTYVTACGNMINLFLTRRSRECFVYIWSVYSWNVDNIMDYDVIRCIFYSEFHDEFGPKAIYQVWIMYYHNWVKYCIISVKPVLSVITVTSRRWGLSPLFDWFSCGGTYAAVVTTACLVLRGGMSFVAAPCLVVAVLSSRCEITSYGVCLLPHRIPLGDEYRYFRQLVTFGP
jgi:hypothetical protein